MNRAERRRTLRTEGQPAAPPRSPIGLVLGCCAAALAAGALSYGWFSAPRPLGAALPKPPPPLFNTDVEVKDTDIAKRQVPEHLLEYLAFQPDGAAPLDRTVTSERLDLAYKLPTGSSTVIYPDEEFLKDHIESQTLFNYNLPVKFMRVSIAERGDDESLTTFASRRRAELKRLEAQFNSRVEPLLLPDYRFEHLEYTRSINGEEQSIYSYFGPYGVYVLAFQFHGRPELHEAMRPYVEKIMKSFAPGPRPKQGLELEYPDGGWEDPGKGGNPRFVRERKESKDETAANQP